MNKWKFLIGVALLGCCILTGCQEHDASGSQELDVMSFNIRYGRANDGDDSWQYRNGLVMGVIKDHQPDIVGLQEALQFQLDEILATFPEFESIGIGRDPGGEGEYAAILYLKERFEEMDSGTFWMSETPEVPSTHWGNTHLRICTWARLLDKQSDQHFYVYNTHFDHRIQLSRENSAVLLAKRISGRAHDDPVIVMGDFNAGEDNPAITYLKGMDSSIGESPVGLVDTYRELYPDEKVVGTFNGFKGVNDGKKIDYVFVFPGTTVEEAKIVRDSVDGRYPSDHYPVSAKVVLLGE
jgi:endonuclease/exonuclease/phosphatase family metal-dependent hydrolase